MNSVYNRSSRSHWRRGLATLAIMLGVLLTACGGGGGGGSGGETVSGSGTNNSFPGSLIGERIEFTVTDARTASSVTEGLVIVYDFSSDGRVQGTNPETGQVIEPVRYEYRASGNTAVITLFYESDGGAGFEEYLLQGSTNILSGTYDYEAVVTSPPDGCCGGAAAGTYRIVPPNNVSVYQATSAAQIFPELEDILQKLTRRDDMVAVSPIGFRNSYVAIQQDGTLVTDTGLKERNVQGDGTSAPVPVKFLSPPSGRYIAVDTPTFQDGKAISEQGEFWFWGGEGNLAPRRDSSLQAPVHGFVERDFGQIVISGPDRKPQYVCYSSDGSCNLVSEQAALDALNVSDAKKAIRASVGSLILLYTNTGDGTLAVGHDCAPGSATCVPPAFPPGLGEILDFDLRQDAFVVAIETSGKVVAWDFQGSLLEVPDETGNNAVAVAVSGTHVAIVRGDGGVVVWRYDADTNAVVDLQVPAELQEVKDVMTTDIDGNFIFLR